MAKKQFFVLLIDAEAKIVALMQRKRPLFVNKL
jgi:hypothetical protein